MTSIQQDILLALCIPCYNGSTKLLHNVQDMLKCKDDRFIICIQDNCSTDNTIIELCKIEDRRLIIRKNKTPIKAYNNYKEALINANAEYVYLLLDKEIVQTNHLVNFLDYLECKKPYFGYVRYEQNERYRIEEYNSGIESIQESGGMGDSHPTGFYYRKDIMLKEVESVMRLTGNGNLWFPDMISNNLGAKYKCTIYYSPLNYFDYEAILGGITKSPVPVNQVYYYGRQRCSDFVIFLSIIISNIKYFSSISDAVFKLALYYIKLVTYTQSCYFSDKQRCNHYCVKTMKIGVFDKIHWSFLILFKTYSICKKNKFGLSRMQWLKLYDRILFFTFPNVHKHIHHSYKLIKNEILSYRWLWFCR